MGSAHVLLIDLDPHVCPENHSERLKRSLHNITSVRALQTITRFPSATASSLPALIILRPSGTEHLSEMVQRLKEMWGPVPILGLFCLGKGTPTAAQHSLLDDLDDFFTCPIRDLDVYIRVQRVLQGERDTIPTSQAVEAQDQHHIESLVGKSAPFLRILHIMRGMARADAPVLITGETGTGKELVARAIHYHSPRQDKPFVPVNCGVLPDHLVENELFGHAKGAYTDASAPEKGLVAEAEGGTLFLDEVDALSASAQVKFLRFLQDRAYRPLGCSKSITADVRIIAATNAHLQQQVQAKQFRDDLYYRLNVLSLSLPPLRERSEDIPLLAAHFLRHYGSQHGYEQLRFANNTIQKLAAYAWPGNVRELESVIQRAVILASSSVLQPHDLELPGLSQGDVVETVSFREAKARMIAQFERSYLINLLSAHDGNVTRSAKHAAKDRRALQRLLQKYDLHRYAFQA